MLFRAFALQSFISKLLLTWLCVLLSWPSHAQSAPPRTRWWGQVVTATGQPLAGVSVWVPGTTFSTSTNAEGQFLLPDLPPGAARLRFEAPTFLAVEVALRDTTRLPLQVRLHSTRPPLRARRPGAAAVSRGDSSE
ncbi:carboxypeptidase regulatory-like domain-containing protein [Hymenobacter sp. YC55]|uniref:carboxypeptidase regulatory-like domain-containing protein n=1 Tax=Hymenobacter sp. YC55 TaxID=3034019 RepID=UPI0023F87F7D|nr:carboxypeptidase regulatory-like domain-containing protein [Hymenobacter sp. YC55]MDF7814209.1 carboxypeptidase regulatory-like domain-containing protein [Hymenobacter sp. YC55]